MCIACFDVYSTFDIDDEIFAFFLSFNHIILVSACH